VILAKAQQVRENYQEKALLDNLPQKTSRPPRLFLASTLINTCHYSGGQKAQRNNTHEKDLEMSDFSIDDLLFIMVISTKQSGFGIMAYRRLHDRCGTVSAAEGAV
jgi:hypothetical protein